MPIRNQTEKRIFWPTAIVSVIAVALAVGSLVNFALQSDEAAKRREQTVVQNGISAKVLEIAHQVVPQAVWDDAVQHLDNQFSLEWAHDNIGQYLSATDNFKFAFVLNAADHPLYGMLDGVDVDPKQYSDIAALSALLLRDVRSKESARGSDGAGKNNASLREPIQATAVKRIHGKVTIVTATLVQPDFGAAAIRNAHAPIIVTGRDVDTRVLSEFADRYMLRDLQLRAANSIPGATGAHVVMRDEANAPIATLTWSPETPGTKLLTQIMPWTVAFILALVAVGFQLWMRARRAAQSLIESEARATHMAFHDALTGIPNRARMEQRLATINAGMRRSLEPFAVHCIDLDLFKDLNDTYGHQVGDELLKCVAQRIKSQCREVDTFARLGGDEFAIIQPAADAKSAEALANRLVQALIEPFDLSIGQKRIGCSLGVTIASEAITDPMEFLRQADLALYRAKANGRGKHCFFEPEMDAAMRARRFLQEDLRTAIASDQLKMVYQAQVGKGDKITGVEALIRWNHPQRGQIPPSVFIPLAEESGMIAEIGEFTLRQAFKDSRRWPGLKVAINVSAIQVQMAGFARRVGELVDEAGVDPRNFELELTEGVLLTDDDQTHTTLQELRSLGFSIALDDFGTGYSSLSYLRRFPITKIKIDRSFVTNLGVDAESDAVVSAIVKLARALNLSVIAEGVETATQRERLLDVGCADIQGFLVSRPVEPGAIQTLLNETALSS